MTEVHLVKYKTDTCYIINSGDKAILVDTSSGEGYETVLAECSKYNIQLILLTHVHFDHAENAEALSKKFNIPVAYNEADDSIFDDYNSQPLHSYGLVGFVVLKASLKVLSQTKVTRPENRFFVKEGDTLAEYGFPDIKVVDFKNA